jgi:glyoxylase-like metal-dependent hydrolase (beta-lactamase superfamily II)
MEEIVSGIFVEDRYSPYNVGLVTLNEGAAVIDVPPHPKDARQWLREAQQTAGVIRYLILTDAQLPRIVGASLWRVPIVAAETTARYIDKLIEDEWKELRSTVQDTYADEADDLSDLQPRPVQIACTHKLWLHRHTPPLEVEVVKGAARGSLWLHVPDQKVLFAGDTVAFNKPPVLAYTPDSKAWLDTLTRLAHLKTVQRIVPGRGANVILRGELEMQREFMRVARRSARKLARNAVPGEGLSKEARELQQAFFPEMKKASDGMQRIREGLEHLVQELRIPEETEAEEAESE